MEAGWTSGTMASYLQGEDGGRMDLWNDGILPQHYTTSPPRRPPSELSLP